MSQDNAWLEQLRGILHMESAPKAYESIWKPLCAHLQEMEGETLTLGLQYAEAHISHWPDTCRHISANSNELGFSSVSGFWSNIVESWMDNLPNYWPLVRSLRYHCEETPETLSSLLAEPQLTRHLTHLDLGGDSIGDDGAVLIASTPQLNHLTELYLGTDRETAHEYNEIGARGFEALISSPYLTQLTSLNLALNQNSIRGGVEAFATSCLEQLTHLDLSENDIGTQGIKAIACSPCLKRLTHLALRGVGVDDEGAKALAASPYLKNLTHLELNANAIGEEGIRAIASSHLSRSVEGLDSQYPNDW